ncbi:MAG: thiosulfate oxidation carrier protein SoxY [Gammaproteobacteria bacterium]|nr:thiosulfate oxidation carrier protein SoxY [Gammaproteobacteria bacterium]
MSIKRRTFLKSTLAGGAVAAGAGLFPQALMAEWPEAAFSAETVDAALSALLGASNHVEDNKIIKIKAPDIAENGAVVPIQVTTSLEKVESISIIAEKNPVPLAASFNFPAGNGEGFVQTRIKMGKTSKVIAVVKADGKLYSGSKEVKVTIGGCGG